MSQSGVIYQFKYPHVDCPEEYIWESGKTFGDSLRKHLRASSPIHQHSQTTGDTVDLECFPIVERETQGVTQNIKEAMYIQVNDPSLNRNMGKYHLPNIWDKHLYLKKSTTATPFQNGPYANPLTTHHIGSTQIFALVSMVPSPHLGAILPTLLP